MRILRIGTLILFILSLFVLGYTVYTVVTADTVAPVISDELGGSIEMSLDFEDSDLLKGLSASDNKDGDITSNILVERISRFSSPGVCNVSYVVFDNANNVCHYERRVTFTDYSLPRLSLEKPLVYYEGGNISFMDRIKLTHAIEGDISHKIKLEASNVDASEVGVYEIQVRAVTSFGEEVYARIPLNVITYSAEAPIINLSQNLVYVKAGEEFNPKLYITDVKDCNKNEIDVSVVYVFNQVDVSKPGYGQVRMEVTDDRGNRGITYLTVIVEE